MVYLPNNVARNVVKAIYCIYVAINVFKVYTGVNLCFSHSLTRA